MEMKRMTHSNAAEQGAASTRFAERCRRIWSALARCFAAARLLGKTEGAAENALRIEEKLSLGPKKMLYLVSCREKEFLVAAGADAIVSMVEVSPSEAMQIPATRKASLSRMQKRERLS